MKKLLYIVALFAFALSAHAAVSVTASGAYPYGFLVENGSVRTPIVQVTGGTTNLVNITVSSGLTLVSTCTTGCPGYATFKVISAGGTITTTGAHGSLVLHSTDEQTITFTSTEDTTKSFTYPVHVASVAGSDFVDVEPVYNQAFKGQLKMLQSYVAGHPGAEDVTWAITTQPSGGNGTLIDAVNRDTYFSATVSGSYTICATSVANGSLSACGKVWVSANTLPRATSPNKTEPTECDNTDPIFSGGQDYEISTVAAFRAINLLTAAPPIIARIKNVDTTGIAPTTYPVSTSIESSGTATQPIYICGVADAAGNLPVVEGQGAQENTNTPTTGLFIDGAGAFKTTIISSHFGEGYELGSVGMNYISFVGLKIHGFHAGNTYFASNGTSTPYCCNASSGIWTRAGQHIHMEGLDLDYNDIGALINNNTSGTGRTYSDYVQMIGNHIHNFGDTGSLQSSTHGAYIQGLHGLFEGNLVDHPVVGMGGDGVKMRSDSSIIRYNTIRGPVEHIIEYPDQEDAWQFVDWNSMLGQPGVTGCPVATCYGTTTNNITFPHIAEHAEDMSKDYYYGNNASNEYGPIGQSGLQYGSFSALQECLNNQSAWCTPGIDRNGHIYVWASNFDQNIGFGGGNEGGVISTVNYNSGGFVGAAMPIQPIVSLINSVMWSDTVTPYPWTINADQAMIATLQTNMTAAGSLGCTGTITGGTTAGWSGYTNAFTYTNSNPIQNHITGLGSTNCLTTTQQPPYNLATFAPIAGSSLFNAASTITDNEIHHMPVRFRPDPENGYMVLRTDGGTTIGAMDAGNLPALSTLAVYPNIINVPSSFGQLFYTAQGNWADGITRVVGAQGKNWNSSNGGAVTCFGPLNPVCNVIANGAGTVSFTYPPYGTGISAASTFTIGGAATASNPQFTPSAGTFTKTQLVYLYSNTANTSATNYICYTVDGTTPTGSGSACTHGSMFIGGIPIATTTTVKAVACSSTQACSAAISSTYNFGGAPILVSMALTPTSLSFVVGGASQTLTCTATMSDASTPACSTVGTVTWLSSVTATATVTSSGVVSPVAVGTSNITASIGAVTSNTVVATVTSGSITVANPTCTPGAGSYGSTQTVSCSSSTAGSIVCGTVDGSTPTAATPGSCSHGTSGPFSVSTSLSIKVLATHVGDTNSAVVTVPYVITSGFNVDPTMSEATIQSVVNSADATTGNTVNFAAGNYTGWTQRLSLPCFNGTIYSGPVNSAGVTYVNNQSVQQTSASPAVLNADNALSGYSILEIQGGNSAHVTPGSGCTVQNLTGNGEMLLITGGTDAINNPSYGIMIQHNTVKNLTAESGVANTAFFSHNTTGVTWFENACVNNAYVGTGCFGALQDNVNAQVISNLIKTGGQGIGSGFDISTGCSGCGIKNNRLEDLQRLGIEITNGNSPANVSGLDITGNLYILNPIGVSVNNLTGWLSLACCYSGVGTFGYSYHANDNTAIMNPAVQPTFGFYAEELTGGSNSQAIRNLVQGKWQVSGPAVAVGDIQSPIDISNTTIEGNIPNGYFGCEYGGTFPNACSNAAGTGIVANITANGMSTSATATQHASTAPAISPASGTFASPPTVTITDSQPNVTIFYTTNGTVPTTASTIYTGAFVCASLPCTVNAIAQWGTGAATAYAYPSGYGWSPSSTTSNSYTATAATVANPTFSPTAGTYAVAQSVTISTVTSGASIIYTNNGTTPTVSSGCTITNGTLYTGVISVPTTITLKAIGCKAGSTASGAVTATYTISTPSVTAPTFSPPSASYPLTQSVTISTITSGASVVYTSNGSTPSVSSDCIITNGILYSGPVTVASSLTLNAIGCKAGSTASNVASAGYVIGIIPAATFTGSFTINGGTTQ